MARQEPVSTIVGRIMVGKNPTIQLEPPGRATIRRRGKVIVEALYRIDDAPDRNEAVELRFESEGGKGKVKATTLTSKDRPFLDDSQWGLLSNEHTFPKEGHYQIHFQLSVNAAFTHWNGAEQHDENIIQHGTLDVHVTE